MAEVNNYLVGSRVRDEEGYKATIRYVGPVAAAKKKDEIWLGVEWDNHSRGKHDGSCVDENGDYHKYFDCVNGAGSFIKPSKVTTGVSFIAALHSRYVSHDAPEIAESNATLPNVFVSTLKGNQKSIEFVGEMKLRKWQQLDGVNRVSIMNGNVSEVDEDVKATAAHLVEVDLQDNLLWKWREVFKLGSQLPLLSVLLLHGNKFQTLTPDILSESLDLQRSSFSVLRVLALNGCNIKSWREVQLLEPSLPVLEELLLVSNVLTDLPRANAELEYTAATGNVSDPADIVHGFKKLRLLDVSNCQLDEWSQVLAFGHLPSLQELVLDNNQLTKTERAPTGHFPSLHRFSLSGTLVSSWADMDTLATFYPKLTVLRMSQIPLFVGKGASEVRPVVIARIPQLLFFNGSQISPRERVDAERGYLRSILFEKNALTAVRKSDSFSAEGPAEVDAAVHSELQSKHPRYDELFAKYSVDMAPVSKAAGLSENIASDLISVTLRNMSFKSNGSLEPLVKKLPKTLTIARLKLIVTQLFGLEHRLQQLSMRLYKDSVPFVLDDESSSIEYFGAIDGAEIFINEAKG